MVDSTGLELTEQPTKTDQSQSTKMEEKSQRFTINYQNHTKAVPVPTPTSY